MSLPTLIIIIAIVALLITFLLGFTGKKIENWPISYLQNFTGSLFIFSGWVKAVDPLGTAYKMEQYFAEFEQAFTGTWFGFIVNWLPWLSENASAFSVIMIVFEIVLGVMLLIGSWRKFTAWAFFLLVGFFTFLTGFTYLTGYVPEEVNFFQFNNWGPYVETNMKVTDCGCFGDFIKLEPKVSFFKDVLLLIPALLFVLFYGKMHQLFSPITRRGIIWASIIGLTVYCFSNYVWDIPHADFRPFKKTANIRIQQAVEELAETSVNVVGYQLTNKNSGEVVELPIAEYLKRYKEFSKEDWNSEQIKSDQVLTLAKNSQFSTGYDLLELNDDQTTEDEIVGYLSDKWKLKGDTITKFVERSKISDFDISNVDGGSVTYDLVSDPQYSFMVVAYKLYGDVETETHLVQDTTFRLDSTMVADTLKVEKVIADIKEVEVQKNLYKWKENYTQPWIEKVQPLLEGAQKNGNKAYAITSFMDPEAIEDFKNKAGINVPVYVADDILLKTIVRSNPGVVLLKNGAVIMKWHHKKLPDFEKIKESYMH